MAAALTILLDDPSRAVRKAIANLLAPSAYAPGHVVRCLASDVDEVALPVLKHSPILTDVNWSTSCRRQRRSSMRHRLS